jgi:hypothetical protein
MSDQPNAPAPAEGEPAPATEAAVTPDSGQPAPSPETPEQTPEQAAEAKSRGDRRFAELTAKLSAREREFARINDENERLRRIAAQVPQQQASPEMQYQQERAQIEAAAEAKAEAKLLQRRFHEEGNAQYADWPTRTQELMAMGADGGFAQLLVNMPGGVRVTAALADDPAAVQRIASIQTMEGRAVALGKYAAQIEDGAGRAVHTPRPVTSAPAPVRTVTGRASPQFNEYNADGQSLVDLYMKQNLERQQRRG